MDLFEDYLLQVELLKEQIPDLAKAILIEHKDVIIGLLQEQLGKGEDKWGLSLHFDHVNAWGVESSGDGYYAESTEKFYAANLFPIKEKKTDAPYNFEWTGDTFEMMDIDVKKEHFDIFSRDGKFKMLKEAYGSDAFDLTEEHNEMINEQMLLPLLDEKLAEKLFHII